MTFPNDSLEKAKLSLGYKYVIGCDEAGRGCLAGPVVAAAVALDHTQSRSHPWLSEVRDSKLLSPQKRKQLARLIKESALAYGIGAADPRTVDRLNIHHASLLAMCRAVSALRRSFSHGTFDNYYLVVDGKFKLPRVFCDQTALVKADTSVLSVSAASILAKAHRDQLMMKHDKRFPGYGFGEHKGYATARHRESIHALGLTRLHRRSFCQKLELVSSFI